MIPIHLILEELQCLKVKNKFLIHKHNAKRAGLHYDLRVERNCMLESWATKKMPDLLEGKVNKIALFPQPVHDPEWFDFDCDELNKEYNNNLRTLKLERIINGS